MPEKNQAANVEGAADFEAALQAAIEKEREVLDKKFAEKEATMKADTEERIRRFEERNAGKIEEKPYCPIKDGKLVPVYSNKMVFDEFRQGMRGIMALEWVEEDHPCVRPEQSKADPYTRLTDWYPLLPGEVIEPTQVVMLAKDIPNRAADMKDDFSETPRASTMKKVKLVTEVIDGRTVQIAKEVEVPVG